MVRSSGHSDQAFPAKRLGIAAGIGGVLSVGGLVLTLVGCRPSVPGARPLPPGLSFSGIWDTNWGQMTLRQTGGVVLGRYAGFRNGSLSGTAEGDLFRFRWTQEESRQYGHGYLRMSPDGRSLEGRWGYLDDAFSGGRWWGKRVD